jgi:hypothetical protein
MDQVAEHLPSKNKKWSSNPKSTKKRKGRKSKMNPNHRIDIEKIRIIANNEK